MEHVRKTERSREAANDTEVASQYLSLMPPAALFSDSDSGAAAEEGSEMNFGKDVSGGVSAINPSEVPPPTTNTQTPIQKREGAETKNRHQRQRRLTSQQRLAQTLAGQDWSEHALSEDTPVPDDGVRGAIAQNYAIGFSRKNLRLIRSAIGLDPTPVIIDRRFIIALRTFQENHNVTENTAGVIGDATMLALNLGGSSTHRRKYRTYRQWFVRNRFWRNMTTDRFLQVRIRLLAMFNLGLEDFQRTQRGRNHTIEVSDQFLAAIINWKFCNHPEDSRIKGQIKEGELSEMLGEAEVERVQQEESEEGPEEESSGVSLEEPNEAAMEAISELARELENEQNEIQQREFLTAVLSEVNLFFSAIRRIKRARRSGSRVARRAQRASALQENDLRFLPMAEMLHQNFEAANLSGWEAGATARNGRSIRNWLRAIKRQVVAALDGRRIANPQSGGGSGDQPIRLSRQDALEELSEDGIDFHSAPINYEHWDPRITDQNGESRPAPLRANDAISNIQQHLNRAQSIDRSLSASLNSNEGEAEMRARLQGLNRNLFPRRIVGVRRNHHVDSNLQSLPLINAGSSRAEVRQAAISWRNRMRQMANSLTELLGRQSQYQRPIRRSNRGAIAVDLHRTGVTVCNHSGRPLNPNMMRMDPLLGVAMTRFLTRLSAFGITEVWTNGNLRAPLSERDTHSTGVAFDIGGFKIGNEATSNENLIHLRSGYPKPVDDPEYGDSRRGHSDWFDDEGSYNQRTHRSWMLGFVQLMPEFFGQILGPGFNNSHMGHFHVQLSGARSHAGVPIRAVSEYEDLSEPMLRAAERANPGWRAAHDLAPE